MARACRAVTLNRRRDWRQAEAWLDKAIPHFARYTQDLPGGAEKLQSLVILRDKVGRVWNERARKELEFAAFAESRSQVDYRSARRKGYFEDL